MDSHSDESWQIRRSEHELFKNQNWNTIGTYLFCSFCQEKV